MEQVTTTKTTDGARPRLPSVTLRYWAAARSAAGLSEETFAGDTVAEVLTAALAEHSESPRFAQVLGVCSLLHGEQPLGSRDPADVVVSDGDVIDLLPPFAGG
jgi:molybdopterin synthase sulfur carrier subunit